MFKFILSHWCKIKKIKKKTGKQNMNTEITEKVFAYNKTRVTIYTHSSYQETQICKFKLLPETM